MIAVITVHYHTNALTQLLKEIECSFLAQNDRNHHFYIGTYNIAKL